MLAELRARALHYYAGVFGLAEIKEPIQVQPGRADPMVQDDPPRKPPQVESQFEAGCLYLSGVLRRNVPAWNDQSSCRLPDLHVCPLYYSRRAPDCNGF